jgi:hypothetical protein
MVEVKAPGSQPIAIIGVYNPPQKKKKRSFKLSRFGPLNFGPYGEAVPEAHAKEEGLASSSDMAGAAASSECLKKANARLGSAYQRMPHTHSTAEEAKSRDAIRRDLVLPQRWQQAHR